MTSGSITKKRILTETVAQIRRHGYEHISLRTISGNLGLTTGSLFHYFPSKQDLLEAAGYVVSAHIASRLVPDAAATGDAGDAGAALLHIGTALLDLLIEEPNLVDFLFYGPLYLAFTRRGPISKKNTRSSVAGPEAPTPEFLGRLHTLMDRACRQYEHPTDPQGLFTQCWSFIQGYGDLVRRQIVAYDKAVPADTLHALLGERRH